MTIALVLSVLGAVGAVALAVFVVVRERTTHRRITDVNWRVDGLEPRLARLEQGKTAREIDQAPVQVPGQPAEVLRPSPNEVMAFAQFLRDLHVAVPEQHIGVARWLAKGAPVTVISVSKGH